MAELEAMTAPGKTGRRRGAKPVLAAVCLGVLLSMAACSRGHQEPVPRTIDASVVEMTWPAGYGAVERPLVEFQHRKHTKALDQEGCEACHPKDRDHPFRPVLAWDSEPAGRDDMIDAYHDSCIGCHQKRLDADRASGPVDCGGCHVPLKPGRSLRLPMRFDYSLHHKHVAATGGEEKCGVCHHVFDKASGKIVDLRGTESNCWDCHRDKDEGAILSRRTAAHLDCVGCHLDKRDASEKTGPWLCDGCHASEGQAEIEQLEDIPRLERGQPDVLWVGKPARTKTGQVPFNHALHESAKVTRACRDCHHLTLKPCKECHTLSGSPEGGGVTLEQAYHARGSGRSCVGCHQQETDRPACAGCHHELNKPPGQHSCTVCHSGPTPDEENIPPAALASAQPVALPAVSEKTFPAWLSMDVQEKFPEMDLMQARADAYLPTRLPHQAIVENLYAGTEGSRLATRFHQQGGILCAGCHHHSPLGQRPPPCSACHGADPDPADDKPELLTAIHRQCIGCHQRMEIGVQGCEDCHPRPDKGGAP